MIWSILRVVLMALGVLQLACLVACVIALFVWSEHDWD